MEGQPPELNISVAETHELLSRGGFVLPPLSNSANTKSYLKQVKAGVYWCAQWKGAQADCKYKLCYRPPVKKEIFRELVEALKKQGKILGFANETKVSKDWLLLMLGSVAPEHQFFEPNYYPSQPTRANVDWAQSDLLSSVNGFRSSNQRIGAALAEMAVVRLGSQVHALTTQINSLQIEGRAANDISMSFEEVQQVEPEKDEKVDSL